MEKATGRLAVKIDDVPVTAVREGNHHREPTVCIQPDVAHEALVQERVDRLPVIDSPMRISCNAERSDRARLTTSSSLKQVMGGSPGNWAYTKPTRAPYSFGMHYAPQQALPVKKHCEHICNVWSEYPDARTDVSRQTAKRGAFNVHAIFRNISVTIEGFPWSNIVELGEQEEYTTIHQRVGGEPPT